MLPKLRPVKTRPPPGGAWCDLAEPVDPHAKYSNRRGAAVGGGAGRDLGAARLPGHRLEIELSPSGRAKCRGCGRRIEKGELRFGERIPNPFAEGETTLWFHPLCAAYKRPEPLLETLGQAVESVPASEPLERAARGSFGHRRLPGIDGAERSPSGKANCRNCRQPIARGDWRIRLRIYEEGLFPPAGFVHLSCRKTYLETDDILDQLLHFSPNLNEGDRAELARAFAADPDPAPRG